MRWNHNLVAAALLASLLSGIPSNGAAAAAPTTARTEAEALKSARLAGRSIEVLGQRTETRQVFANPDGTLTSETHASPVRLRRGDGWVDVDTTLHHLPDGSVAPRATALKMRFSGGGGGRLATLYDNGRAIGLAWPGPLPTPTLDDNTATYPEVLPGVDLKVSANVHGFSEVLVVKDRQAAVNPALRRIAFVLHTEAVRARTTAAGGVLAADTAGVDVFRSPPPQMWDSSGPEPMDLKALTANPRKGSRVATMRSELHDGELAIVPDQALLRSGTYPIFIDPSFSGGKLAWTPVDRAYPNQEYWNSSHRPEAGHYGSGTKRSFFRMDTDNINGKTIISATFRITGEWTWNWSCNVKPKVNLYQTRSISSSTNWNNQPEWSDWLDSWSGSLGHEGCAVRPIEFNATDAARNAARGRWPHTTFGLRVPLDQEDNTTYWFGFKNNPKIIVNYNTVPSVPTNMGTMPGTPCVTGASRPYLNSTMPKLLAKIYDPDKANDGVRAEFQVNTYNPAASAWEAYGGNRVTNYVASATAVTHSVTLSVTNGRSYAWRVKAYDGTDSSGWTKWCEFTVDTTNPASLPQVTSTDYPKDTPGTWHGGVGQPGAFTFAPGPDDGDVSGYRYALGDISVQRSVTAPSPGAAVTVQVAPTHDWLNTLYVWPVDRAGNIGTRYVTYDFYVGGPTAPVAHWRLDEGTGTTASDSGTGTATPAAFYGGAGWAVGRVVKAGTFDGADDYAATAGPVIDTSKAFSVSAWVRLTDTSVNHTIVTQAGNRAGGFQLYYSSYSKTWVFNRHATDSDNPTIVRAIADEPARRGVWTHLLGIYDPTYHQLRLYVDGRKQSTTGTFTTPWAANGAVQIGRLKYNGTYQEYFKGDIDDVRIYNRIVSDDSLAGEVAEMANRPTWRRGLWRLDEGTGTTADGAPGKTVTLGGGATWTPDERGGSALRLNGTTAYAATPTLQPPYLANSFTVSAWVRLAADTGTATAVSKDGNRMSGFYLGYRTSFGDGSKRWSFSVCSADADSGYTFSHATSPVGELVAVNEWTFLVGVFDYPMGRLRLYINGQLVDDVAYTDHWDASGPLQIGRSKYKGNIVDWFPGDIDDVRIYSGAMADRDVLDLYFSYFG